VRALAARWPLGLASSSNREIIDLFLALASFGDAFRVAISSEEVVPGRPAPEVYLRAAEEIGAGPERSSAVEDSSNGLRAAAAAGMPVFAVPNPHYPVAEDALALAAATVPTVGDVTPGLVASLGGPRTPPRSARER
jgi:beta-phosphoglucomutase-like phosphatase (HAD superfamily)